MFALDIEDRATVYSEDEDTMQAYVDGKWHRRFLSRSVTACGHPYHSQYTPLRREALTGELCRNCFSIYELAEADQAKEDTEQETR